MAAEPWTRGAVVKVRIGIHTGEAELAAGVYVGIDVHRAARIMAAAHGGQILVSEATRALVSRSMPAGASLRDLGEHQLKDLPEPERLYQVNAEGLDADFPAPRTIDSTPNNLPVSTTALVGRAAELEQLARLLRGDTVRLVTLTGPGGIGKTRLAVQAATDALEHFADGVFFVDLAARARADRASSSRSPRRRVSRSRAIATCARRSSAHLRPLQLLLVLDNFEQVTAAADDAGELVRQCPRLAMLVTSRESLHVRGEQLLPVPPLTLPTGSAGAMGSSAVTLFVERGREARPSFGLDDETAPVVGEICARLDGLPLAIELAAARLRLFSPTELRDRLRGGLDVLRGGARDLPDRQRTLRDTIAWSYDLLDDDDRALFKVLAVFPSAQVQDVEQVCAGIDALAGVDVVDGLGSLVDKSLLRTADGERQRLSMLETIHEYARDELDRDADLASAARGAHAAHFAAFAVRLNERMGGRERAAAIDELAAELDNVLAAWHFHVDAGDLAGAKSMLDPLWTLYDTRGWYHAAIGITRTCSTSSSRATRRRGRRTRRSRCG